jgi:hypothetical protein
MAPSFANMHPHARAAFIRAQIEHILNVQPVPAKPETAPVSSNAPAVAPTSSPAPAEKKPRKPRARKPAQQTTTAQASDIPTAAPAFVQHSADSERHARKCQICRHRHRQAIENDFVGWRHPNRISDDYHVGYDALYRHARATGLLQRRCENVSIVVQKLLEEVESVEAPSAFAILRGVRTLACLNSRGQWVEPAITHVVVNSTKPPAQSAGATSTTANELSGSPVADLAPADVQPVSPSPVPSLPDAAAAPARPRPIRRRAPNRKAYEKLELDLNPTKQTLEVISNRNKV